MPRSRTFSLDLGTLRRLAGTRAFQLGEEYVAEGRLRGLVEHDGKITAMVRGTRKYRVELDVGNEEPQYSCTCPVGDDGVFCKHCVAVGLAWLQPGEDARLKPRRSERSTITPAKVQAYLATRSHDDLVGILISQAKEDDRLWRRLVMEMASSRPRGVDLAAYRRAIDDAVAAGDFVPYEEAGGYAQGIHEVADAVEKLLRQGHASEVIGLTEHALKAVERAIELVDDSDGHLGGVLDRLQDLHHTACRKARPDPKALARRLFEWELGSEWGLFAGAADRYADVLGEEGLAGYRKLAEAQWARVHPLRPGDQDPDRSGKRFRITTMMETLARLVGDLESLVASKQRDLSLPYDFLEIADLYRQGGKHDLALEWAERGVRAFPEQGDSRLTEFLADEYHRCNRHNEAMALVWAEFEAAPFLPHFQSLKRHADRAGGWPEWSERAISRVREQIALPRPDRRRPTGWSAETDHSELVRIFLWEGEGEAAWRESQEGGCSDALWLDLAARREKDLPEDALAVYQRQVAPTLAPGQNHAYREAVLLLRKIRTLMVRLGRGDEFKAYLDTVRGVHQRKRNFIRMLERARWS